jgi:xanthine dehydrogenase accessory factor
VTRLQRSRLTIHAPRLVWIRGGGDLGTGVAHRLHRAGMHVVVSELTQPLVVRRAVAFASAIYDDSIILEGVEARLVRDMGDVQNLLGLGIVPVVADATGSTVALLKPGAVVDARMAKRNLGTTLNDAAIVIGLGPGFVADQDVHAVVETMRGHDLGRVILQGSAEPDSQTPAAVQGYGRERVLRAPCSGLFHSELHIGEHVQPGQVVAWVAQEPLLASLAGVLRGLLHDGLLVYQGQKLGDIDPRGIAEHCFTISDKARAIGGGVLEAILYLADTRDRAVPFDNQPLLN